MPGSTKTEGVGAAPSPGWRRRTRRAHVPPAGSRRPAGTGVLRWPWASAAPLQQCVPRVPGLSVRSLSSEHSVLGSIVPRGVCCCVTVTSRQSSCVSGSQHWLCAHGGAIWWDRGSDRRSVRGMARQGGVRWCSFHQHRFSRLNSEIMIELQGSAEECVGKSCVPFSLPCC